MVDEAGGEGEFGEGDFFVGFAFGDQAEVLAFAVGELLEGGSGGGASGVGD